MGVRLGRHEAGGSRQGRKRSGEMLGWGWSKTAGGGGRGSMFGLRGAFSGTPCGEGRERFVRLGSTI